MFKIIKSITDIVKLCISLSKKYWYIFDPLLSGFMSAIASFYGWAVWYFGKPLVIWFSFLLGLLIIALLRLVYCLINCAYSNWKIQKEIDKIEKESKAKMAENEHNSQLRRQEEKERATNEMLKNGNEHGIIMQALTTLNKPNQDIVKCKNELGIVKTYYPLKTGLPIETQNQITKFLAHTELQVERISSDTKLTDIQYERLDDILEGYLKRRDEGVKSLLRKVANIITNDKSPTNISKDAINFIMKLDNSDLGILKKQFRYVFRGKGIYYFDYRNNKIHHYLANKGLMSNSYSLEFYGEVYKDEAVGNITPKAQNFRKNAFTFCPKIQIRKHLYTNVYLLAKEEQDISICCIIDQTTYNVEKNEVLLAIPLYVTLTNIGSELYDLLKDDLDNKLPFSYLKHILKNLRHKYKKYQFVLMKAH